MRAGTASHLPAFTHLSKDHIRLCGNALCFRYRVWATWSRRLPACWHRKLLSLCPASFPNLLFLPPTSGAPVPRVAWAQLTFTALSCNHPHLATCVSPYRTLAPQGAFTEAPPGTLMWAQSLAPSLVWSRHLTLLLPAHLLHEQQPGWAQVLNQRRGP